jgi:heme-degrading monooxygenase HmoA
VGHAPGKGSGRPSRIGHSTRKEIDVVQVKSIPPSDDVKAIVGAIPGVRFTPGVVVGQEGPEGHLGPEAAGAVLILHVTLADEDAAERFWRTTTSVKQSLSQAPGFIRLFSLFEGVNGYLVAFWRTVEDAHAFAKSQRHRAAMDAFDRDHFQYSHFVGLFRAERAHNRNIYCEACGRATPMPAKACSGCGNPLHDVFADRDAVEA